MAKENIYLSFDPFTNSEDDMIKLTDDNGNDVTKEHGVGYDGNGCYTVTLNQDNLKDD